MSKWGIGISAHMEGLTIDRSEDNLPILEIIRVEHTGINAGGFVDMEVDVHEYSFQCSMKWEARSLAESKQRGDDV